MKACLRFISLVLALSLCLTGAAFANEYDTDQGVAVIANKVIDSEIKSAAAMLPADSLPAKSAVLMEQSTGKVLFSLNEHEKLPPASITKIMSMLLVMQAVESGKIKLEDMVTASEEASKMGGSQIWLKAGEQMTVNELLKATAVSSANDATYALGELIAGSELAFVDMMNQEAKRLGMENTHFECSAGLDHDGHLTTAHDVALMSRELMKYPKIRDYTMIWMDSLRGGKTELVNTNRLVRFYEGATGLKTGTTSKAGSCLSATAERSGMGLIAVVMGSPNSDKRFAAARALLDFGFANYMTYIPPTPQEELVPIKVRMGVADQVEASVGQPPSYVIQKSSKDTVTQNVTLEQELTAPIAEGQKIGTVEVVCDGEVLGEYDVVAAQAVPRMTFLKATQLLLGFATNMK